MDGENGLVKCIICIRDLFELNGIIYKMQKKVRKTYKCERGIEESREDIQNETRKMDMNRFILHRYIK